MQFFICEHCKEKRVKNPRVKNQRFCSKPECQRKRKALWQEKKMRTDPDYRDNQQQSKKNWAENNPGYWKDYREKNPQKTLRNRILQKIRDQKRRNTAKRLKNLAKMDALKLYPGRASGLYWLVPVLAKMDALKVQLVDITDNKSSFS